MKTIVFTRERKKKTQLVSGGSYGPSCHRLANPVLQGGIQVRLWSKNKTPVGARSQLVGTTWLLALVYQTGNYVHHVRGNHYPLPAYQHQMSMWPILLEPTHFFKRIQKSVFLLEIASFEDVETNSFLYTVMAKQSTTFGSETATWQPLTLVTIAILRQDTAYSF